MKSPAGFDIGGRRVGSDSPCYLIAEMSGNHMHDIERAKDIVRAAAEAGADAVKLQTYTADTLTINCDNEYFQIGKGTVWQGRTLHELYREAYTPWEWTAELVALGNSLGMAVFSSPFDDSAVDFLEEFDVPAYKIASFELIDHGLLRKVAATGKPVIASTGMASLAEIEEAVAVLREAGAAGVALLKCTSAYPASPANANLRTIPDLAERFDCVSGLSDHTLGTAVPVAAVSLGAKIVEKHLTLSRADGGVDAAFSLEPEEFAEMVRSVRVAEQALGRACYVVSGEEEASRCFRRSLFVVRDVAAGEALTESNVRSIRPGHGLAPKYYGQVLGKRAVCAIPRGTPLAWDLFAD